MSPKDLPERPLAVVTARGIDKRFRNGLHALTQIDLDLSRGEILALVGPSGCGKSTVLRLIAGLDQADSGTLAVAAGERMSYVFQDATLMPWLTVEANVRITLDLARVARREAHERVHKLLQTVGLADCAQRYPRQLSGGMRMRVSLARALITQPTLLLMDEPFGALDDITRMRLDDEVLKLARERHLTVIFVTHNLSEAVYLADRVLVLSPRPGRIVGEVAIGAGIRSQGFRGSAGFAQHICQVADLLHDCERA